MAIIEIPLTKGMVALIDDIDYLSVSQYKWFYDSNNRNGYAKRTFKRQSIYMHRFIVNPPNGLQVDHINGEGTDNRRSNLRIVKEIDNHHNMRIRQGGTSIYKGVYWYKRYQLWHAQIRSDGNRYHLGYFDDEMEAALAYDKAAIEFFGEYAKTNF